MIWIRCKIFKVCILRCCRLVVGGLVKVLKILVDDLLLKVRFCKIVNLFIYGFVFN